MSLTPLPKRPKIEGVTDIFDNEYVCCMCFEQLYEETIYIDFSGQKHDICKQCYFHGE